MLTQSPTIQRVSQRLILSIAAMRLHDLYLRDISQAYVQSTTNLNREFYVRRPQELQNELGIGRDTVLKVLKPIYGVPEAGNNWFKTYHSHHIQRLKMNQSTYDPCLLLCNEPFGMVGLRLTTRAVSRQGLCRKGARRVTQGKVHGQGTGTTDSRYPSEIQRRPDTTHPRTAM